MKKILIISLFAFSITESFAQSYPPGKIVFQNQTNKVLSYQAATNDGGFSNTGCFSKGAQGFSWESLSKEPISYTVRISTCTNGQPDQGSNEVWSTPVVGTSLFNSGDYYVWNCTDTECTAEY